MKKYLLTILNITVVYITYGQPNSNSYIDLIEKGRTLYKAKDYKNAAITYRSAIKIAGYQTILYDHNRAGFCWALANYPDSAFYHLNIISNLKGLTFSDVDDIINDDDYIPIYNDARWIEVKNKMFLRAYKTFVSVQIENGGKALDFGIKDTAFAMALGNNSDSAISHLNDVSYYFLQKKKLDKAYKLFKVSIDNFPPNASLLLNMVDYYLATGDKGKAYIYFSKAEVIKYKQSNIFLNPLLKIDSALKTEYRDFSKRMGYKVLPPEYLITTVANALLKNEMTDKAYSLFQMGMEDYPYSFALYKEIGSFYDKKGDKEKANEYFSKSLILQYKLPENFFQPSFDMKEYFSFRDKNSVKIKGDKVFQSEGFFNNLANHFLLYQMYDKAELLLKMSIEKYPQSLNVYNRMSAYYKTIGDKVKEAELNKQAQAIKDFYQQKGITGIQILPDTTYNIEVANPAYHENCPTILLHDVYNNSWSNRYKPFADLMANDGFRIIPIQTQFTKQSLDKINVVVIVYPLNKIEDPEIKILNDWIRNGGSLLAITHHDNLVFDVFLESLGVQTQEINVTHDSIHGLERDGISIQPAYIVFSEKDKLLGNHPIIRGRNNSERIRQVKTFGGGRSILGPPGSSVLLRLSESAEDFMNIDPVQPGRSRVAFKSRGLRSFGVAFTLGKGKVVVLSSAGILTASLFPPDWGKLGMNNPGSDDKQFALNIMRWLTGYLK